MPPGTHVALHAAASGEPNALDGIRSAAPALQPDASPNQGGCALPECPLENFNVHGERGNALHRLGATALACNSTQVYTHLWSDGRDNNPCPRVDITGDHDGLTHSRRREPGNQNSSFSGSRKVTESQLTMLQVMELEIDNVSSWDNTRTTVPEIMGRASVDAWLPSTREVK